MGPTAHAQMSFNHGGAASCHQLGSGKARGRQQEEQTLGAATERHSNTLLTRGIPNPHPLWLKQPLSHNREGIYKLFYQRQHLPLSLHSNLCRAKPTALPPAIAPPEALVPRGKEATQLQATPRVPEQPFEGQLSCSICAATQQRNPVQQQG